MVTDELRRYVAENLDLGHHPNDIAQGLIDQGWSELDVNHVFDEFFPPEPEKPAPIFSFDTDNKTFLPLVLGGLVIALGSVFFGVHIMFSGLNNNELQGSDNQIALEGNDGVSSNPPAIEAEEVTLPLDVEEAEESNLESEEATVPLDVEETEEYSLESAEPVPPQETPVTPESTVVDNPPVFSPQFETSEEDVDMTSSEDDIEIDHSDIAQFQGAISTKEEQLEFAKNFATCEESQVTDGVDFGGFVLTSDRTILGWQTDGKCHYKENQMGVSETYCKFSADEIAAISAEEVEITNHVGNVTYSSNSSGETYSDTDSDGNAVITFKTDSYYSLDGGPEKIHTLATLKVDPEVCELPF